MTSDEKLGWEGCQNVGHGDVTSQADYEISRIEARIKDLHYVLPMDPLL